MVNFHVTHVKFKKPVFLNPLDGTVYNLNEENYAKKGNRIFFKNIPVGDWPVVIVDKNWIDLNN